MMPIYSFCFIEMERVNLIIILGHVKWYSSPKVGQSNHSKVRACCDLRVPASVGPEGPFSEVCLKQFLGTQEQLWHSSPVKIDIWFQCPSVSMFIIRSFDLGSRKGNVLPWKEDWGSSGWLSGTCSWEDLHRIGPIYLSALLRLPDVLVPHQQVWC